MKEKTNEVNGEMKKPKRKTAQSPLGELKKRQQQDLLEQRDVSKNINGIKDHTKPSTSGESMAVILTQGLMAKDRAKVDSVLSKPDISIIQATLAEMPVTNIVPLLKAIESNLLSRNVMDIRPWLRWAQATISMHMSYLSTLPTLDSEIGGLMDWMRTRATNSSRLLALHGKMCVLVEHIEKRSNKHLEPLPQPIVVFNTDEVATSDDEESLIEESDAGSSENEDWWDDELLLKDEAMGTEDSESEEESEDEENGQKDVEMEEDNEDDGEDEEDDDFDEDSDE
ncbi:unnamed protein product, partial [Mesorhabditis belari]|uniref:Small-subunit processome Utp12 domain-containing protein n=1 Tax=Mesorhabditis belari TaxID=2138241 RepID=A0AAF3FMZ3_9BILA